MVHAGPDITRHRLSHAMRVKELATVCIRMIAIVAAPVLGAQTPRKDLQGKVTLPWRI